MPDFKPIRKAMVIIAVSNYDPPYEALPGTLTSARRIADWAKAPGQGRNYKVLEITDAPMAGKPGTPVTVAQVLGTVSGRVVGVQGDVAAGASVAVRQAADEVTETGTVIGIQGRIGG